MSSTSIVLKNDESNPCGNDLSQVKEIHVAIVCDTITKDGNKLQNVDNLKTKLPEAPIIPVRKDGIFTQLDNETKKGSQSGEGTNCRKSRWSAKRNKREEIECDKCGKKVKSKSALKYHKSREEVSEDFKCPHCSFSTRRKVDLEKHLLQHGTSSRNACNYCEKSFTTVRKLEEHVNCHTKQQQYPCEKCSYVTYHRACLRRHILVKHTTSKLYECPVCHAILKHATTFKVHMRIHLDEKPFVCKLCGKCFRSGSQLAAHRKIHGENTFICSQCSRGFKTKHHLLRHEIIHSKMKPFSCEICYYSCNVQTNLVKHMKRSHNMLNFSMAKPKKILMSEENVESPEKRRGEEFASTILQEFSGRHDAQVTFDSLRAKLKMNEEVRKMKLEMAVMESANRATAKKRKAKYTRNGERGNSDSDYGVVVIQSNNKNMSKTIAIDEASGTIVPMSSHTETYKNPSSDLSAISNSIIQFDENTGQLYQFNTDAIQENIMSYGQNKPVNFADNTLESKNQSLNGETPLVIDTNTSAVPTFYCDSIKSTTFGNILTLNENDSSKGNQDVFLIITEAGASGN